MLILPKQQVMNPEDVATTVLNRFRERYYGDGTVDVGVLEDNPLEPGEIVAELQRMATDKPDAYALLWAYYWWEGQEDTAWEWWDRGLDMESPLMEAINLDNMEQEVGEDDWDGEFDAFDDETEAGG